MIISLENQWGKNYEEFVHSLDAGSFFHCRSWLAILRDVLHKPIYLAIATSQEKQIHGVLPLALCRTLTGKALVSVPFRDQGGPLAHDASAFVDLIREAKDLSFQLKASRISFQRLESRYYELLYAEGFQTQKRGVDSILNLSDTEDEYWWRLNSPTRRAIKKARKSGIDVIIDTEGKYIKDFFELFVQIRRNLGVVAYPFSFFKRLFLSGSEGVKLMIARSHEGLVIGGLMFLHHGNKAYSGYIGYAPRYLQFRVVDILFYETISWARQAGIKWFVFGTDSSHQESLIRYKKKWLAETEEVYTWHWTKAGKHYQMPDTDGPKFRLIRKVLRQAPKPLFFMLSRFSLYYWD